MSASNLARFAGVKRLAYMGRRAIWGACAAVLVFGWTAAAQIPRAPEIGPGTNTLFGRVVDAGTGAPVGGAKVLLFSYSGTDAPGAAVFYGLGLPGSSSVSAPRGVITNGDGGFLFGQLPAGRYAVFASALAYLSGSYLAPGGGPVHFVSVADNDRPAPVVVRLMKYGAISGTVLDDRGDPVVDAPVQAYTRSGTDLQQSATAVRTDDRGAYRIPVPPGAYVVGVVTSARTIPAALGNAIDASVSDQMALFEVTKAIAGTLEFDLTSYGPGHVPSGEGTRVGDWVLQRKGPMPPPSPDGRMLAYATTLYPSASVPSEATTVDVRSGEERTAIDMTLRVSPAVTISGVLSMPGAPAENISVQLRPMRAGDEHDASPTGQFTTITTASGAFAFLGVPQGQYLLGASSVQLEDQNSGRPALAVSGHQTLAVGDRDVSGLTLALKPGVRVSGRVDFRDGRPQIQGRPSLNFRPSNATIWRALPAYLGPDGTFSTQTEPGRYQILTAGIPGALVSISRGGRILTDQSVTIDGDVSDLVLTISNNPQHITGTVTDANGAPATHANVVMFPADTTTWRQGILSDKRRCVTAASSSGAFDCAGLSIGEYYAAAIDSQVYVRTDDAAFLDRLIAGAARVTLNENGDAAVALKLFTPKDR